MVVLRNERPNFPTKLEIDHFTDISNLFRGGGGREGGKLHGEGSYFYKIRLPKVGLIREGGLKESRRSITTLGSQDW